ncbi:Voltage-dependent calcium channel A type alpha-1 [Aphelenchoides fujianensis]|nr:Voltage-dependent calcium channel A type alpha-1 [Aphelenchoides fujianensis]
MLRNIAPPVGFGRKCPYRLAYKHLIRMNMPVAEDGTCHFTTTLLSIKMRPVEEMDEADEELRQTLRQDLAAEGEEEHDRLGREFSTRSKGNPLDWLQVPPNNELCFQKLTVGKIYAGLLILENYRARKSGTEIGGGGLFGLRSLVAAAKSAAGAGSLPNNTPQTMTGGHTAEHANTPNSAHMADGGLFPLMNTPRRQQPPSPHSAHSRPYTLFSTLVDTIQANKSGDHKPNDFDGDYEHKQPGGGRRLSDMFARMRHRDSEGGEPHRAANRRFPAIGEHAHHYEEHPEEAETQQLLHQSRSPSPTDYRQKPLVGPLLQNPAHLPRFRHPKNFDLERRPSIGRKPGDQYQMAHFSHHSPTRAHNQFQQRGHSAFYNPHPQEAPFQAYNTPADGGSEEEEAVSTNAPLFTYNSTPQQQRRLPGRRAVERGFSMDHSQPGYSPERAGNGEDYGMSIPQLRALARSFTEHPIFVAERPGYAPPPPANTTPREPAYSTHSLPPVSLPHGRRPVGWVVPDANAISYDQNYAAAIDPSGPRSLVIRSQPGNIPLSDSEPDEDHYAVI